MAKKKSDSETSSGAAKPYVVLARKYRPQSFDDLIGQEAMVKTLRNAFASGRIAQAYMLTGVRGVGKTTTARIIARALNYETDTVKTPTIDMPTLGRHCAEIMESRHLDVMETRCCVKYGRRQRARDYRHCSTRAVDRAHAACSSSTKSTCCRRAPSTRS